MRAISFSGALDVNRQKTMKTDCEFKKKIKKYLVLSID